MRFLANELCCLGKDVLLYSKGLYSLHHKADGVLSFFSSRRNWDCPTPSSAGECAPPPGSGVGGHTSKFGHGDRHCGTLGGLHYLFNLLLTTCIPMHTTNEELYRGRSNVAFTQYIRIWFEASAQPLYSKIASRAAALHSVAAALYN